MLSLLLLLGCVDAPRSKPLPATDLQGEDSPDPVSDDSAGDSSVSDDSGPADDSASGGDDSETPWSLPERPDLSNPSASASWRYGGGVDHPDRVDPDWPVVTRVSTASALHAALDGAAPGDIVYVEDDAVIDLTGDPICVPQGVWLAGGRGLDGAPGGAILGTDAVTSPIIQICGDDVRITGLRILGADDGECPPEYPDSCTEPDRTGGVNCRDCTPASIGIQARGYDRLEVDNNELAGWSYAAVWLTDSVDNQVHHNHVHHTWRQGLGYGVVLTRGGDGLVTVNIEWNRFDYNRHAVAGSGEPGQDYVARNNLVLEHANGHVFDMHGEDENTDNGSELAGGWIEIYDNTVLVDDNYALVVRGRPDHGSWLYGNCLARSSSSAALQRFFTGNFHLDEDPSGASAPNTYGASGSDCLGVRWCASSGGTGPWRSLTASSIGLSQLHLADLDGDGIDDVLRASGSQWTWSRSGQSSWQTLRSESETAFLVGDLDGDGTDDLFRATGGEWQWSSGASTAWTRINSSSTTTENLRLADLDGDGRQDVVAVSGGALVWSRSGSSRWETRNASSPALSELHFADMDSDGADDALWFTGSEWRMSSGGSGSWTRINGSSYGASSVTVVDLDGDGQAEVLRAGSDAWYASWSGRGGWDRVRISGLSPAALLWGELDGRPGADALNAGCH